MSDVRDILELDQGTPQNVPPSKEAIVRANKVDLQ